MLKNSEISLSLIVPVYDEEYDIAPCLGAMVRKLQDLLFKRKLADYELLVFSSYGKFINLPFYFIGNKKIKFFERGKINKIGNMFARGIRLASSEYVGLLSPYNQVQLDVLEDILNALSTHNMVVAYIGNPSARPWHRGVASEFNNKIVNWLFGLNLRYYHLNFYRTAAVKKVKTTTDSHAALVEAAVWLAKSGANIAQVPFVMVPHNFKSKSRAFALDNVKCIFKTYIRLFWKIMVLRKRIDLRGG